MGGSMGSQIRSGRRRNEKNFALKGTRTPTLLSSILHLVAIPTEIYRLLI
jgi:hypothetical protein